MRAIKQDSLMRGKIKVQKEDQIEPVYVRMKGYNPTSIIRYLLSD